ncbi:MAG TPA: FG-GAP-like repeat-containing protein [Polyangia bacterium]|nr:FG-GAP-like repeat-containing protein [Polyangia bacterium]
MIGSFSMGCAAPPKDDEAATEKRSALTAVLFAPYVAYPTGSWPEAVAVGDLNGDGRLDVAMTTATNNDPANDNMLHVFLQAADGTLQPRVKYPLGNTPQSIDIGDVNGDGLADVVVGNFNSSTIGVLLQNAAGTLDPMVTYPTVNSLCVKIGDFNGDGRMDVVGINWGSRDDGVDVFLQTSAGTLAPPVTYHETHGGYDEVDVGDVNGDGRTDIIVMSGQTFDPNIGVLLQNADGTMAPPVYYSVGGSVLTRGVAVDDANGDGLADIVVSYGGNRPNSFIGRFLQNATNTFDPAVSYASYDIPSAVVLADVDEDGRKDVVVTHSGWNAMGVYRQMASGELGAEELYAIPYASQYQPQGLAVGDINGDGLPDAVIADYNHGLVVLRHVDDVPPRVAVTSPTGGTFYPNVPFTISWSASDNAALGSFDLSASLDGGATFTPIPGCTALAATARSCTWSPSAPPTTGVDIRVTAKDAAGNQASADTLINLVAPSLSVSAPAAGTSWFVGTPLAIAWSGNLPASATMHVELSRDGGGSFETLAAAAPNTGSFTWTVTGPDTASALVRVTASSPFTASAVSGTVALVTPVLTVTGPAPGSVAYAGTPSTITWIDNLPASAATLIELSRDGGGSFETLAAGVPNTGSFAWTVTGADAAAALVRVTVSGPALASGVSGTFALVTPALTVSGPADGVTAYAGTPLTIAWTSNLPPTGTVMIELSADGGASFQTLAAAVPNSGSFAWTVTGPDTAAAQLRISTSDPALSVGVSGTFGIVTPVVTVTGPAAGASWPIGTAQTITWTTNLASAPSVLVELSTDGGGSYTTLAAAAPNTGSFAWTAVGPATAAAVVRVSLNGGVPGSGVSAPFALSSDALAVTAPAAGASWTIGTARSITWTSNLPSSATVKIELSRNGGTSYTTLAASAPNTGSFAWTVSGAATSSALVRVSANGFAASAVSGAFALVAATITVTSPNTAVTWLTGSVHPITWTHDLGAGAQFKLEISRNGGSTWSLITAAAPSGGATSGSYNWTVTSPKTNTARIRVTWTGNTAVYDVGNVNFKID